MDISIIVPVYNEKGNLTLLQEELDKVLTEQKYTYEIIYVDDGSNDGSVARIKEIVASSSQAKGVMLVRNFGQTQAIAAGVDHSTGDIIVTIDADLQNDPADIPKLLSKLEEGFEVVSGWRINRQDNYFSRKIPSYLANKISAKLTGVNVHDLGCTLKAYKRTVLESITLYGEIHRFLLIYAALGGARITEIPVNHRKRKSGDSKYGLSRIFKVFLDMFTILFLWKCVNRPIYAFGAVGIVSILASFFTALFIALRKVLWGGVWVSPLLFLFVIFFMMGVQFILMGILAEFIIRLYYDSQQQKRYVIKEIQENVVS